MCAWFCRSPKRDDADAAAAAPGAHGPSLGDRAMGTTKSELIRSMEELEDAPIPPIGKLLDFDAMCRVTSQRVAVGMLEMTVLGCRNVARGYTHLRCVVANDLLPDHNYRKKNLGSRSTRFTRLGGTAAWKPHCKFCVPVSWSDKRVVIELRGRKLRWRVLGVVEINLFGLIQERILRDGGGLEPDIEGWVPVSDARNNTTAELHVKVWYRHGYDHIARPILAPVLQRTRTLRKSYDQEGDEEGNNNDEHVGKEGGEEGEEGEGEDGEGEKGQGREEGQDEAKARKPTRGSAGDDNNARAMRQSASASVRVETRPNSRPSRIASSYFFDNSPLAHAPPPRPPLPSSVDKARALADNADEPPHVRAGAERLRELWPLFKTGDIVLYTTPATLKKGCLECLANKATQVVTGSPYTHVGIVVVAQDHDGSKRVLLLEATVNGDSTPDFLQRTPNRQCIFCFDIVDRLKGSSGLDYLPLAEPLGEEQDAKLQRFLCKEWRRDPQYDDKDFLHTGISEIMHKTLGSRVARRAGARENWEKFMCSELVGASLKLAFPELEDLNVSTIAPASFLKPKVWPMLDHKNIQPISIVPGQK